MTRTADFDYYLPQELVAQYPLAERDTARLLVLRRDTGEIGHAGFRDLAAHLDEGDLLVVNDTRVFPARLQGRCVVDRSVGRQALSAREPGRPAGEKGAAEVGKARRLTTEWR